MGRYGVPGTLGTTHARRARRWSAARAVTGRRELSAWVRVTVYELLSLASGERFDRAVEPVRAVDATAYLMLATAPNSSYELVARANAE